MAELILSTFHAVIHCVLLRFQQLLALSNKQLSERSFAIVVQPSISINYYPM